MNTPIPAPTAPEITTPSPFVTEAAFISLLGEMNERLAKAEAVNAILVDGVDALAAELAELRAA